MNKKILYCISVGGFYGVIEDEIIKRDNLFLCAKRVFSLEAVPPSTQIKRIGGEDITFIISVYDNVMMNCNFISDLSENSQLYKTILSKEGRTS